MQAGIAWDGGKQGRSVPASLSKLGLGPGNGT